MAMIAIFLDLEEGHALATISLAKKLTGRGHSVCYIGMEGAGEFVRAQGFNFIPVLQEIYPFRRTADIGDVGFPHFAPLITGRVLDHVMAALKPDAVLVLSMYDLEAIAIRYRYGVPVVLLTPHFMILTRVEICRAAVERLLQTEGPGVYELTRLVKSTGAELHGLRDLAAMILDLPELVFLPEAFALPGQRHDKQRYFVGALVDLDRTKEPLPWLIDPGRYRIFCSMGSQSDIKAASSRRFFHTVIETMASLKDCQLVVSIGRGFDIHEFSDAPQNVLVTNWAPQLAVLAHSDLMITHGGIGTVRECILMGVPMVVFPLMRDQFDCAQCVIRHGLGVRGELTDASSADIIALIGEVRGEPSFKRQTTWMQEEFRKADKAELALKVIEECIAQPCCPPIRCRS